MISCLTSDCFSNANISNNSCTNQQQVKNSFKGVKNCFKRVKNNEKSQSNDENKAKIMNRRQCMIIKIYYKNHKKNS